MIDKEKPTPSPLVGTVGTGPAIPDRELIEVAYRLARTRAILAEKLPKGLVRNGAWNILLELFVAQVEGRSLGMAEILSSANETSSTTLRLIDRLAEQDLIERIIDTQDHRRKILQISASGFAAMTEYLQTLAGGQ